MFIPGYTPAYGYPYQPQPGYGYPPIQQPQNKINSGLVRTVLMMGQALHGVTLASGALNGNFDIGDFFGS